MGLWLLLLACGGADDGYPVTATLPDAGPDVDEMAGCVGRSVVSLDCETCLSPGEGYTAIRESGWCQFVPGVGYAERDVGEERYYCGADGIRRCECVRNGGPDPHWNVSYTCEDL